MAVPALNSGSTESIQASPPRDQLMFVAAQLYGRGMKRKDIAIAMAPHLRPAGYAENPYHPESLKQVRFKLRAMEMKPELRDLVYNTALKDLDMEVPEILKGIAGKAKKGRVDAARLALEVTGRHNPKGEQTPTSITINIANIPRPD